MQDGNPQDWDALVSIVKNWWESIDFAAIFSAPFFVPLLAVIVGAGASLGGTWVLTRSQRLNKRAEFLQEWRREDFYDIRAFQEVIIEALEAVEAEVSYFMSTDTAVITRENWEPVKIEVVLRRGQMLSSRIEDEKIIDRWRKFRDRAEETSESIRRCIEAQNDYDSIADELKELHKWRLDNVNRYKNDVPGSLQKVREAMGEKMVEEFSRVLRELKGT